MTQFTCKGVKQINNRILFKHLYHSYLSPFFISERVPNGEFPEILIAKCRSRFYCTWFFCWGGGKGVCGRLMSPVHETQSMREIRLLRGRLPRKGRGLTGMLSKCWNMAKRLRLWVFNTTFKNISVFYRNSGFNLVSYMFVIQKPCIIYVCDYTRCTFVNSTLATSSAWNVGKLLWHLH